ncbi:putative regulatory protein, FmdB family [Chthonomonas calidirosea]|uniref:Putative regulatory protein, FmdB family n=1 Tax=Chthonomonas calidirosea (strain DSM 23976 / ICMP 18418 / T49) TaxID=1303518 RepID=S0EZ02_CHTCT|nr:zinc ribbon domain-containing protein [Chthonomonas calidirosea]CCW35857.1 putative regulatory protein, FmdB family [Chthonomonas calidirosea T49]CEK18014.1 putative regulatory protein, FmdB family [Chthonomonas calidirosea]CEK19040.1 putative regulatory protein, FmdB family [Chthonomonas calidirosea]
MPIYEFHCKDCNENFKVLRPANACEEVVCKHCGSQRTVRLLSVTAPTTTNETAGLSAFAGGGG